jgi:benzoyl-CoA reductase subunit C
MSLENRKAGEAMGAFQELAEVSGTLENRHTDAWKREGRKIVGFVCSYMPEEILYALDILPYRITGKGVQETSHADSYLTRVNCSFARSCLELGFTGRYDFLDGAVWNNGCDHIRRCYDNWKAKIPFPFMYMLPVPHKISPQGREWYKGEVLKFMEAVEQHFGVKVSPEKLAGAVSTYNETRKLLRKLYDLRTVDPPPFTGAEVLTILSAGTSMPRTEYNRLLRELLESEEPDRGGAPNARVRLLVAGSLMDDVDFVANVEDLGATVVTDALCFGARSFWNLTDESGDVLEHLIDRYYEHPPCPRMTGAYSMRLAFLREQIERAGVEGVILQHIKFCDLHGTDNALLKRDLEKDGIPVMELERQYGPLADAGRIRTRVQAFLERIGG